MDVAVIPSEQFREKLDQGSSDGCEESPEEEEEGIKKKGPSRRFSKKEKRGGELKSSFRDWEKRRMR